MTATTSDLRAAVAHLYSVFGRYHVETLTGCPHCTSDEHGRILAATPLDKLRSEQLERYAFKAMTTWGSVRDFKHFLPRILELTSLSDSPGWPDIEIVFSKLDDGRWHTWPAAEIEAIRRYLLAIWNDLLGMYPHHLEAESVLCAIGRAEANLRPYLEVWERSSSRSALLHLADFLQHNVTHLVRKHHLIDAFWDARPAQERQVKEWLLDSRCIEEWEKRLIDAAELQSDERVSGAFDLLQVLRNAAQWMH